MYMYICLTFNFCYILWHFFLFFGFYQKSREQAGHAALIFAFVFVFVFLFVFVIVFLLVRSGVLITLIKYLNGHKSLVSLFEGVLWMYLSLSLYLSLYLSLSSSFCWSGHVFSSPWSNVSRVTSLQGHSVVVFLKSSLSEWVSDKVTYWAVSWTAKKARIIFGERYLPEKINKYDFWRFKV